MIYIFADCELDTQQRLLKYAGQAIHLRSQAYKVFLYLLENRDCVFSQADLIDALWLDPFVKPWTVETTIREIRRALGDSIKTQRIIETRPRQGYRFIAHLKAPFEIIDPAEPVTSETTNKPDGWPCHVCQHVNRITELQQSRFCTQCGAPFGSVCPQCEANNGPHDKYCGACGHALSAPLPEASSGSVPSPSIAVSERRQLTVLSCDLVDSVTLAEQFELEDYHDIIRLYRDMCDAMIRHYEGHIAHDLGAALLIYFGHPQSHEDDAQRAVRTGLAITEGLAALNTRLWGEKNIALAVRWGVHTGPMVVEAITSTVPAGVVALSEVPHMAQQIQRLAVPGTGVIGASTARLVEAYFVCEALGAQLLEANAQPMPLFRVLAPAALSQKGRTPFVGREAEMAMLWDRWTQAKDGFGQVVLLNGDPGIGKSRLVHTMKDSLSEVAYILECRCSPYHQHSVFYPVIDVLERQLLHWEVAESPEAKLHKLELFLSECALPLADTVPLLAALLSLPDIAERYPALHLTSQQQRHKILEMLLSILHTLTTEHPMLLIVEDLHWIDPSTQELLDLLVERIPTQRLCAVLTYRPVFQAPWGQHSYITPIPLTRLSRLSAKQMVSHVTGKKVLPEGVLRQIIDKTDGVPLFVEEFTKTLMEAGIMQEIDGHYELLAPLQAIAIPATLHDSLMARLDRLDIAKRVAQVGAVLGRQFDYALLKAVWEQDEHLLQRGLSRLVEAELLYQQGRLPQASYTFKHALIQDTAYQSLLKRARQQYHRRAAQVLIERFPEIADLQPEVPARHYTEAGLIERALLYWQRAGQLAVERQANVEAIHRFTQGLNLLQHLPDMSERVQQELALQLAIGPPLIMVKGHSAREVESTYTRAYELCQQLGDHSQRFWALTGLWRLYLTRGQLKRSHDIGEQCLMLAQHLQDATLLLEAHTMLGSSLLFLGEWSASHRHFEQGTTLYDARQSQIQTFASSLNSGVVCLSRSSWTLWMLGYPDQAFKRAHEALALAESLSHTNSRCLALHYLAVLHQCRRELQSVQIRAEAVMELCREQSFIQWLAGAMCMRGWALAEQGMIQEGTIQLRDGMMSWQSIGTCLAQTHMLLRLAEAYKQGGEIEAGLHTLTAALTAVEATSEHYYESELYRLKGELLTLQSFGERACSARLRAEAESCFLRALEIARYQGAKSLELRAATSLCRLWVQQRDKRTVSRDMLGSIYDWFTEGFDTPDLQEAKALLGVLA